MPCSGKRRMVQQKTPEATPGRGRDLMVPQMGKEYFPNAI